MGDPYQNTPKLEPVVSAGSKRTNKVEVSFSRSELQEVRDKAKAARLALATYIRVSALMYRRKS